MIYFKTKIAETLGDTKLNFLSLLAWGARYKLMCHIGQSPVINYLYFKPDIPIDDDKFVEILKINRETWDRVKLELLLYGGFALDDKGALGIPKWAEHQSSYYARDMNKKRDYMRGYMKRVRRSKKLTKVNNCLTEKLTVSKLVSGKSPSVDSSVSTSVSRLLVPVEAKNLDKDFKDFKDFKDKDLTTLSLRDSQRKQPADKCPCLKDILKYFGDKFQALIGDQYHCQFGKDGKLIKLLYTQYEKTYKEKTKDFVFDLVDIYMTEIKERISKGYKSNPSIGMLYKEVPRILVILNEKRNDREKQQWNQP